MAYKDYLITCLSYLKMPQKRASISVAKQTKAQVGLEIGGPSSFFGLRSFLPVYVFAQKVDGVNFSTNTVWEGGIKQGENYNYFSGKTGFQYISEAATLDGITKSDYDFILSCHSLEHIANPIAAIKQWAEKLKVGGLFFLVLPDKRYTFDYNRPYTSFAHLLEDKKNQSDEHDTTHFAEVLNLHDLSRDAVVASKAELEKRIRDNFHNRCVHHHVFSLNLMQQMLEYCGFDIVHQFEAAPFHMGIVGKKR